MASFLSLVHMKQDLWTPSMYTSIIYISLFIMYIIQKYRILLFAYDMYTMIVSRIFYYLYVNMFIIIKRSI